jgi:GNAT acetyltransferase-like protein
VIIETDRLTLRPLTLADAPVLQELLDDPSISDQLPSVPHPLPPGGAEQWIRETMNDLTFACVGREEATMGVLGGFIGLHLEPGNRAQIGGWCGKPFRHNGYAVEAGRAVVRHGYEVLGLETIYALRKGRLWVATRDFSDGKLPFRHVRDQEHILQDVGEPTSNLSRPIAPVGRRTARLRRLFDRG